VSSGTGASPNVATTHVPARSTVPFSVWIFVRIIVPTGPILIQYALKYLHLYNPPFPQPTYVTLLFSLALATLTEYTDITAIIYGCVIPALCGCVLYTVYILESKNPDDYRLALIAGFYLWLLLLTINIIRTGIDGVKRYLERRTR
jgi:hypothetical protein